MGGGERRDAEAELNLPPGFRFHPTDDELVVHYLCRKAAHQPLPVPIIADVDLYKFDPWDLPEKALFGQREWYFFTPRDRKYPNGSRPNRAAGRGYWKATGADKPVSPPGSGRPIAIKKALVFYNGKAPKGVKTDWIMHEYRLADTNRSAAASGGKKAGLRLDEWVLCRLYNKKNNWEKTTEQFTESMDETASESLRTPESDIDHPSPDLDQQQGYPAQPYYNPGFLQPVKEVKEESDWFLDLNLEDLQGSLPAFGSGNSLELPSQDYYYSTLDLPQLRPGQSGGMPPPF